MKPDHPVKMARDAYARGGAGELVRAGRRRVARAIWPGDLVVATSRPRRPGKPPRQRPPLRAEDVSHTDALAFFEGRRAGYEQLVARVARYLQPEDVVLDVGANIGYFSLVLGEVTGLRGTVHLFEPVPHLAELCEKTLAGAPFSAVVHPYGLAEEPAQAEIFVAADGNLGWNTLVAEAASAGMRRVPIELRTFAAAGIAEVPTLVKIDVEGAEHRVLEGLWASLVEWSPRPVILCEVGWGNGHPQWSEALPVLQRLESELGYRAEHLDGSPLELAGIARTTDVLFVPAELSSGSVGPDGGPAESAASGR